MLDPVKVVPVYETKFYENKLALAAIKLGFAQSINGRSHQETRLLRNLHQGGLIKLDERYH